MSKNKFGRPIWRARLTNGASRTVCRPHKRTSEQAVGEGRPLSRQRHSLHNLLPPSLPPPPKIAQLEPLQHSFVLWRTEAPAAAAAPRDAHPPSFYFPRSPSISTVAGKTNGLTTNILTGYVIDTHAGLRLVFRTARCDSSQRGSLQPV